MKKIVSAALITLCALATSTAFAGRITIDFEHTPGADGLLNTADDVPMPATFMQPLRDQFSSIGLTFTQGTLFQSNFYDGNPSNHFISSTNPVALLSKPVIGISIGSYSYWDAVLTAYDIDGNAIVSNRLVNSTPGVNPFSGELALTSTQLIYGFSILPDKPNYILNLDNLTLTFADSPADVPEPPTTALLALGMILAGSSLRGRKGKRS
jgi:hypothetical protein